MPIHAAPSRLRAFRIKLLPLGLPRSTENRYLCLPESQTSSAPPRGHTNPLIIYGVLFALNRTTIWSMGVGIMAEYRINQKGSRKADTGEDTWKLVSFIEC